MQPPKNKKNQCLNTLKSRILSLDIAPGSDLDEVTLCHDFGISRTPLREVFHRLAGDGFIRLEKNRGAKVASMDLPTMRVFFQTAPLIYCSIARLAAENRSAQQVIDLKKVQQDFAKEAVSSDVVAVALLNHRFHEILGEMSQNPYLIAGLNRMLIDHTRLSQTFFAPKTDTDRNRVRRAIDQHDAMIAAVEAQDAQEITDLTLQHWDLSRDQMERFVRPDPLPIDLAPAREMANEV